MSNKVLRPDFGSKPVRTIHVALEGEEVLVRRVRRGLKEPARDRVTGQAPKVPLWMVVPHEPEPRLVQVLAVDTAKTYRIAADAYPDRGTACAWEYRRVVHKADLASLRASTEPLEALEMFREAAQAALQTAARDARLAAAWSQWAKKLAAHQKGAEGGTR